MELATLLPGKVFLPNATAYEASLNSYWSQQEQALYPSCIISTSNSSEIAIGVKYLANENYKNPGSCLFAVRSGGYVFESFLT
jgi:hypothetical protein